MAEQLPTNATHTTDAFETYLVIRETPDYPASLVDADPTGGFLPAVVARIERKGLSVGGVVGVSPATTIYVNRYGRTAPEPQRNPERFHLQINAPGGALLGLVSFAHSYNPRTRRHRNGGWGYSSRAVKRALLG